MASNTADTTPSDAWETYDSIEPLTDRYEGFILDQFGVMHNGAHALSGASECVQALALAGKKLIILSNSSSASASTIAKLPKLGFDPNNFLDAVTSGEEASRYIKEHYAGKKALFVTWKTPKTPSPSLFLEKCGDITVTDKVEEADFVLLHGVDVLRGPGADGEAVETDLGNFFVTGDFSVVDPILKQAAERKLVAICANPDFISIQPDGSQVHMPGQMARRYTDNFGATVVPFGKPHRGHFEACIAKLGLPKDKVVHVGDSLHHDVAGANATGIDCIFVTSGVHCEEMGAKFGKLPTPEALASLFAKHKQVPTHVVPLFMM